MRNPQKFKKYLSRMVGRHGVRPDPIAVEAVLTWKAQNRHAIDWLLRVPELLQKTVKMYANKVCPMQQQR